MTIITKTLLNAYADIAQQTYDEPLGTTTARDVSAGSFGPYTEITQDIDGSFGFQGRAFFNSSNNERVIGFTGTEGFGESLTEVLPDLITDLSLATAGLSPQDAAAQAFIAQSLPATQRSGL